MTTVLAETSHALPLASAAISFRAGAVHDPPERAGLARVVARMLRRGCRGYGSDELEQRIDALGGELGAHVGLGTTSIHCEFLKRSFEPMAELVGRLLAEPTFDEEELGRLRRQVEAEIVDSRDNDGFLAARALRRSLFRDHPHAVRVAGTIPTVRAIEGRDVESYHAQHFCRDNAVVAVSGDLSATEVQAFVDTLTSRLPQGTAAPYPDTPPPPPQGRNLIVVDKPDRTQSQMVIGTLGTHPHDEDHTALLVANTAFGGTFTSRLMQEVRSKRGWSYGASSHLGSGRLRESFAMWTAPSAGDTAACLALQLELLSRWRSEGITEEELAFCKQYLRGSYAFEIDTAKKRVGQQLERALLDLPADYHERFLERVDAVTLTEANAAVRRRLSDRHLWVSLVATESGIGAEVRDAIEDLGEAFVVPYDLE